MNADEALEIAKKVVPDLDFGQQVDVAIEILKAYFKGCSEELAWHRQYLTK